MPGCAEPAGAGAGAQRTGAMRVHGSEGVMGALQAGKRADAAGCECGCLALHAGHWASRRCTLQKNVEKIEGNLAKLEERLAHEKEKFQEYDVELKQHEER